MHPSIDISTLNLEQVRRLPSYELPKGRHLGSYGMGCHLDAPGFPSYMVQNIYTGRGNSPEAPQAATVVLDVEGVLRVLQTNSTSEETYSQRLRRIWAPLPLDHERVQMWMANIYRHFRHCYQDVERPEYGRPGMLIYPLPSYKKELPKTFRVPASASEEDMTLLRHQMQAEMDRVNLVNDQEEARAARIAIPDNHQAVRTIRKFYPDYQPNLEWIAAPPASTGQEDWWETAAVRPEPSECIHRNNLTGGVYSSTWAHPTKPGTHCLWCGRTNPTEDAHA